MLLYGVWMGSKCLSFGIWGVMLSIRAQSAKYEVMTEHVQ
jgi:hypothetical protein